MLTHGNIVADSAGMVRVTHVAPGIVRTAYGDEEQIPGRVLYLSQGKSVVAFLIKIREHNFVCSTSICGRINVSCSAQPDGGSHKHGHVYLQGAQTALNVGKCKGDMQYCACISTPFLSALLHDHVG